MELPTVNIDPYADDYTKAFTRGRQSMLKEVKELLAASKEELEQLKTRCELLQTENKGLLVANSKLCQTKDQQGYVNALEAALDCLQFAALLELDEHDMPNLKAVLLGSMSLRDNLGEDGKRLRQSAKVD